MVSMSPRSRPPSDGILLAHTALVALTPLVPLPFVDELLESYLLRRMVRGLAAAHRLRIWDEEVAALVDRPSSRLLGRALLGAALSPLKRFLRKTFLVLVGKKVVDSASACYHRGWLIDLAFARGWCAPHGPHSARALREAIDAVLRDVPVATSPVTQAIRAGLERSRDGLALALTPVREWVAVLRREPIDAEVARTVHDAERRAEAAGVIAELRRALSDVPAEHFQALERALALRLGSHTGSEGPGVIRSGG
jgi:hypothetical protein